MNWILDLIVVAILAVSVWFAMKKGLIKTVFSLVGGVVAVVLAISFSTPVANWLDTEFVRPAIQKTILTAVNGSDLVADYDEAIATIDVAGKLAAMPEGLRKTLEKMNVDVDQISADAAQSQANSAAAREELINSIAIPVSKSVCKAVALVGLFVVFFILVFVASRLLDAVFRVLPFAKSVNKSGGFVLGLLRGVLLVLIFSAVVYGLAAGNMLVNTQQVEKTILLKWINQVNPILTLFK